jgi:hypothetical protein
MNARAPLGPTAFVIVCAVCAASGWLLSLAHQLNAAGYLLAFGAAAVALWFLRKLDHEAPPGFARSFRLRPRRFRRVLPALFLVTAALVFLGGALHAPNNYDALTYRAPRVLHWLAEERWHWIATSNVRMNIGATVTEWLLAPLFAFTRSDRLLFLITWSAFLLLPGLVFSTFRRAGVAPRVAWAWMWLLPSGFGYVMQASSIGNDLVGATLALAAINFALLARASGRVAHLWLCLLASALLTGTKASNLPLLLPVLIAALPSIRPLRSRIPGTVAVVALAASVSFLPTAVLNFRHAGHWTGDVGNTSGARLTNPVAGLLGNGLQLAAHCAMPPVLPGARKIEDKVYQLLPPDLRLFLKREFPRFDLALGELAQEEMSGLGLGVSAAMVLALCAGCLGLIRGGGAARSGWLRTPAVWVGIGAWGATLFYMAKMGSEATARLLLPYYALLPLPFLAIRPQARLVRSAGWFLLSLLTTATVLVPVVLTPSRPLWPVQKTLTWMLARAPTSGALDRVRMVYATYARRNDLLAPLRAHLPAEVGRVGFVGGEDDTEYALWRPFGKRRVEHWLGEGRLRPRDQLAASWAVVKREALEAATGGKLDGWLRAGGGEIVARETIVSKVSAGPEEWFVVRFPAAVRPE